MEKLQLPTHTHTQVRAYKPPGQGRASGGLILFAARSLNLSVVHASRKFIVARVTTNRVAFILACVYLAPDVDVLRSLEELSAYLQGDENVLVIGDLNCRK